MNLNSQKIKTIILCGGTGTRLKEETEFKPKPLVEIGGKPILWHIMKIYSHYGYQDFILALGYKGSSIKDYFIKQKHHTSDFAFNTANGNVTNFFESDQKDNFNIIFAETGLETPHGERILKLRPYIQEDIFMATYGDGVADIDIEKLITFHKGHGKIATITGAHPESRWGLVNSNEQNIVTEFAQKPMLYDYINGGFMVFNKEIFDYIEAGEMIEDALLKLIPKGELAIYKHEGFWFGMDTHKDFLHLNKLWETDPKWKIWEMSHQAHLTPVLEKPNTLSQKTVLVTGGAGFIGHHVVNSLLKAHHRVIIIDNLSSGKKEYINPRATFYHIDVRDKNIAEIFQKENPNIVFHFAAQPLVDEAHKNPTESFETNIMGTVNVLENCRQLKNLEAVIMVSSDKAYGKSDLLPYTEDTPLRGDHPYDVSKSSADLIAMTYFKTYNLPVAITRFSNVYGPGDTNLSRIIPGIMDALLNNKEFLIRSDGTMIREYTYVQDIAEACMLLAKNINENKGQAFNFGSNNIFSVNEIIQKIQNILGKNITSTILNIAKNEIPKQHLDWSKARARLSWEPQTSFEHGIKETFDWHKNLYQKY